MLIIINWVSEERLMDGREQKWKEEFLDEKKIIETSTGLAAEREEISVT